MQNAARFQQQPIAYVVDQKVAMTSELILNKNCCILQSMLCRMRRMINASESNRLDKLMTPIYGVLREVILKGFRYRQTRYSEELSNHTPRTRASLVNDLIIMQFLRQRLEVFGIRPFRVHGRVLFDFRGEAILHFKKLDRHLLSSNLQTEFAFAFTRQQELPGIPSKLPRLIAGYIPSRDWTSIAEMHVTLPNGNKVEWSHSLLEEPQTLADLQEQQGNERRDRTEQRRK